jgi:hypothetical protein
MGKQTGAVVGAYNEYLKTLYSGDIPQLMSEYFKLWREADSLVNMGSSGIGDTNTVPDTTGQIYNAHPNWKK